MDIALFSIKPNYAQAILEGTKKFEFRLKRCKKTINRIVIYETSPVCKITGEVFVTRVIEDTPQDLWNITRHNAGIKINDFIKYYSKKYTGIAYCLERPQKFVPSISLNQINISFAPQSFVYLSENQYQLLHSFLIE